MYYHLTIISFPMNFNINSVGKYNCALLNMYVEIRSVLLKFVRYVYTLNHTCTSVSRYSAPSVDSSMEEHKSDTVSNTASHLPTYFNSKGSWAVAPIDLLFSSG